LRLVSLASVVSVLLCGCASSNPTEVDDLGASAQALSGGSCLTHDVHVTDQPGPTQGLWNGTNTLETAPAVGTNAEFVFVFDKPVSADKLQAATTIKVASCLDSSATPGHVVPIKVLARASWLNTVVTIQHPTEAFTPGCTYALSIAGTQTVSNLFQCLDKSAGFSFRVRANDEPTALVKEATSVRYWPRVFDVAAFKLPETLDLTPGAIVQRYAEGMGIRPYTDTFTEVTSGPSHPQYKVYAQNYFGVPVSGYGYTFLMNPAGFVESANGHVAQGIDLDVHPIVLDAAAVVAATAAVLKSHRFGLPPVLLPTEKKLIVVSRTQAPATPQFRLAWRVQLADQVSHQSFVVLIDARDLSVLRAPSPSGRSQCATQDISRLTLATPDVSGQVSANPQTTVYSDPDAFEMSHYSGPSSAPYVLRTAGLDAQTLPVLTGQCGTNPGQQTTNGAILATVPGTMFDGSASWTPEVTSAAASYMGVQRTMEYLASAQTPVIGGTPAQEPWIGVDGFGATPIDVTVEARDNNRFQPAATPGGPVLLRYTWSSANPSGTGNLAGTGAALDETGHEFGHGIVDAIFGAYSDPELQAIDEGFGDMLGSAVEHTVRAQGPWLDDKNPVNWCIGGDRVANAIDPGTGQVKQCYRDLQRPDLSFQTLSAAPSTPGGSPYTPQVIASPDAFNDCNYAQLPLNPTEHDLDVFSHKNSTVAGHWFYLMIVGPPKGTNGIDCAPGSTGLSCDYVISGPPLSWNDAFAVALHGLKLMGQEAGFEAFANSTVSAADKLFAGDADHDQKVQRVVDSWAAVGLWEHYWEGMTGAIKPGRNDVGVSPWQPIEWLIQPGEKSWDVDVSTKEDFSVLYASRTVTDTTVEDGKTYGVLRVALAPNTPYYWRERPSTGAPWDCFPSHLFKTGNAPKVDGIEMIANLVSPGVVRPGTVEAQWNPIPGATAYEVYVAAKPPGGPGDPKCTAGTGVIDVKVDPAAAGPSTLIAGIQPLSSYTIDVQATGPADPSGVAPKSDCASSFFGTIEMRPPVPTAPVEAAGFDYFSPHAAGSAQLAWQWTALDGPSSSRIDFSPRDAHGSCTSTVTHAETVPIDCGRSLAGCSGFLTTDVFPTPNPNGAWANPSGYCWTVTSIAQNGQTASAATPLGADGVTPVPLHFSNSFILSGPKPSSPGLPQGNVEVDGTPGLIEGRAYESTDPVAFTWSPVAHASGYFISGGRWPWRFPTWADEPQNCFAGANPATGTVITCNDGPVEIDFPKQEVTGGATSVQIPADQAGRGRYCWTVWPELENPSSPGTANPIQPDVIPQANVYCYTTEAAKPIFQPGNPLPDGNGFSPADIVFKIVFPYVPEGRYSIDFNGAHGTSTHSPSCDVQTTNDPSRWQPGENFDFADLYDCEYEVHVTPDPDTDYKIVATVTGYSGDLTETLPFKTGSCGSQDHPCCDGDTCSASDTVCVKSSHTCKHCGDPTDPCCDTNPSCAINRICDPGTNTCMFCGTMAGQLCCTDAASIGDLGGKCKRVHTNLTCNESTQRCESCGSPGQPCCTESPLCDPGSTCDSATHQCKAPPVCTTPTVPTNLTPGETGAPADTDASFGPIFGASEQPVSPRWTGNGDSYNVKWSTISEALDGTWGTLVDTETVTVTGTELDNTAINDLHGFPGLQVIYQVQAVNKCGDVSAFSAPYLYSLGAF